MSSGTFAPMTGTATPTPPAVASGHLETSRAMARVLVEGGNAFDAAVAGGLAAAVVEPCLTSLADGGFLTALPAGGQAVVVDFFVAAPGLDAASPPDLRGLVCAPVDFGGVMQDFHVGAASVAVPGVLSGYLHVLDRWGRLDRERVFAPATELARGGIEVDVWLARLLELLAPILARSEQGRELFFRHDRPLGVGDHFANPALAELLHDVGAGSRGAFRVEELGGCLTGEDLRRYEVVEREPLMTTYGDATLIENPPPSFGGNLVCGALELLGGRSRFDPGSPESVCDLAEALVHMVDLRGRLGPGTSRGTTHLGAIDGEGTAVAMTTSNGSGSGEFASGLGVQLNNMMGEEDLQPAFGGAHLVATDGEAAGDPRRGGAGIVLDP